MEVVTGAVDEFGHPRLGGIGARLEHEIEKRTGYETRPRSWVTCSAAAPRPRSIACSRPGWGWRRSRAAHDGAWGMMTSLRGNEIKLVTLAEAVAEVRQVPTEEYERFGVLFG